MVNKENIVNSFFADCWEYLALSLLCLCPVPCDFNFVVHHRKTSKGNSCDVMMR
jgi:hypothetical protein